jgi:GATA zinc finger
MERQRQVSRLLVVPQHTRSQVSSIVSAAASAFHHCITGMVSSLCGSCVITLLTQAKKRSASPAGSEHSGGAAATQAPVMGQHRSAPLPAEVLNLSQGRPGGAGGAGDSASGSWRCRNCDASTAETPMRRWGPAGPGTLCNACGLMYSSKGVLRTLADRVPDSEPQVGCCPSQPP